MSGYAKYYMERLVNVVYHIVYKQKKGTNILCQFPQVTSAGFKPATF